MAGVRAGTMSSALSRRDAEKGREDALLADGARVEPLEPCSKTPEGKASFTTTVVNITTATLGSGILSLPWAAQGSSAVVVLLVTAAVLVFNAWAAGLLVDAAESTGVMDLGALLGKCVGPFAERACNFSIWVCMFAVLVSYLIIIAGGTARLVGPGDVLLEAGSGGRALFLAVVSLVLTPICFVPSSRLAFSSTLAVVVNVYLFLLVFGEGVSAPRSTCVVGVGMGAITFVSTLGTAVVIQMCLLPLYADMENPSPKKFRRAVNVAFAAVGFLFVAFAVIADVAYGNEIESNVLLNIKSGGWGVVAQIGMIAVMLGVYPLMLMPMVAPLGRRGLGTGVVIALVWATAVFVTDLGVLNVYNGAFSCFCYSTLCPVLVGLSDPRRPRVLLGAVFVIGVGVSLLGAVVDPSNHAKELHCVWPKAS
jgi:amino acid permease